MTLREVRATLRALGINISVKDGEYRVAFPDGARAEASAYYTDDLADALDTGRMMAKEDRGVFCECDRTDCHGSFDEPCQHRAADVVTGRRGRGSIRVCLNCAATHADRRADFNMGPGYDRLARLRREEKQQGTVVRLRAAAEALAAARTALEPLTGHAEFGGIASAVHDGCDDLGSDLSELADRIEAGSVLTPEQQAAAKAIGQALAKEGK